MTDQSLCFCKRRVRSIAFFIALLACCSTLVSYSESKLVFAQERTTLDDGSPQQTDMPKPEATPASSPAQKANEPEDQSSEPEFPRGKVFQREYDFTEAEVKMKYSMYLPEKYDKSKSYPLIVALHGLYSNPRQILNYPGFVKHAEEQGYILVAPMGYNSRGWYGSRGKRGGRRGDPENLGELSEKDVMNVLNITLDEFSIDRDRIYLYGHSMGGGGTLHFAMTYPEIWAAMAPVAPAIWSSTSRLKSAKAIPAIVIQGDKDSLVSVRGTRRWIEEMKSLDMKHRYIEEKDGGHVTVAFNYYDEIFEFFKDNPKSARENKPETSSPMDTPENPDAKPSDAKDSEAQQDDN